MARYLDLAGWPRRSHFELFRSYEQPFWNLCAAVDVTALHALCGATDGPSFFLAALHLSLQAANEVEELRYRLRGDEVLVHEVIHGGSTVLRPDGTFTFAYFPFCPRFAEFAAGAAPVLAAAKASQGPLDPRTDRDDLIHYSVIPWVAFSSFAHARRQLPGDSVPKIVFGKHHEVAGRRQMPVSVEVHHALVDGLHVGRFLAAFAARLAAPQLD